MLLMQARNHKRANTLDYSLLNAHHHSFLLEIQVDTHSYRTLWNCRYTSNLDQFVVGKVDLCPDHTLNKIVSLYNNIVKLSFETYMGTPLLHHLHDLNKEVW